jgi:hypothetical protein
MRTSSCKSFPRRPSAYVALAALATMGLVGGIRVTPPTAHVIPASGPAVPASLDALIVPSGVIPGVTITLQNNQTDMCLDSNDSNPAFDSVYTSPCNGTATEEWYASATGLGGWTIVDSAGLCLSSPDTGTAPGPVYTETCGSGDIQSWTYNTVPGISGATWDLGQGAVCLDSNSGPAWYAPNPSAGGVVWVDACVGTGSQVWNSPIYPVGILYALTSPSGAWYPPEL